MTSILSIPRRAARGGVLVVGGGFAGSYVARRLGKAGATIVNLTNFMLYTPLLPGGRLGRGRAPPRGRADPDDVPAPELVVGAVEEIDADNQVARVRTETGVVDITFEEVVIALGALSRIPALRGCASTRCSSRTWPTRSPSATTSSTSSSWPTPTSRAPSGV